MLQHIHQLAGPAEGEAQTDALLLERLARQRDQGAFETLLGRHGPLVWRVCCRVLSRSHDAEEAFQNTFLVLFQRAGSIRKADSLPSWLHGVAYRVASRMRQHIVRPLPHEGGSARQTPASPDREAVCRELGEAVERELNCLPDKYRQPLVLCYWEGLTNEEAALRLGWACGTVKTRLARGRRLLHERLAGKGIVLPAGLMVTLLAPAGVRAVVPLALLQPTRTATQSGPAVARALALAAGGARGLAPGQVKVGLLLLLTGVLAAAAAVLPAPVKPTARAELRRVAPLLTARQRLDLHGDPLPQGALARLGTIRLRHGDRVTCLAFSPDGNNLASGGYDQAVAIWDADTGKELARLTGHRTGIEAVAFSPDGKFLASGGGGPVGRGGEDHIIRVWDVGARKQVAGFGPGGVTVVSVALSPGGKLLAAVLADGNTDLWDVVATRRLRRTAGQGKAILSPDARLAAWASRGTLVVADLVLGKEAFRLDLPASSAALAFSPDSASLAVSDGEGGIHLLNATTGKLLGRLAGRKPAGTAGAFLSGGKGFASWGGRGPGCLWDLATGKARPQPDWPTSGLVFGKDQAAAPGVGGGAIERWQLSARRPLNPADHQGGIGSVALAAEGTLLVTYSPSERCVRRWDARSWQQRSHLRIQQPAEGRIAAVALSPDGKLLAAGGLKHDNRGGDLVPVLWLLDPVTGKRVCSLQGHRDWVGAVAFSPDSKRLASADAAREVLLWESPTGKLLHRLRCHARVGAVTFSPDGQILAVAENGPPNPGLCLWEVSTGKLLRRFSRGYCDTSSLAFSADSRMVAVASGEQDISVWEVVTGQKRLTLSTRGKGWVRSVAFSPDGALLGASAGNDVHLWGVWSGQRIGSFTGHRGPVQSVAFTSDGKALISASMDTTALVWDLGKVGRVAVAVGPEGAECEAHQLWQVLASEDGARAYGAMRFLAADSVRAYTLLAGRLHPVRALAAGTQEEVARLIRELDDDRFEVRERASRQRAKMDESVEPALRRALARGPSPEVSRRLKQLLTALALAQQDPEALRNLRALEVLEHLGTPQARRLLEQLAGGSPTARLTREAKASLARLGKQERKR
jgi:RNA polymerase sigma factor (sigma-70 family)